MPLEPTRIKTCDFRKSWTVQEQEWATHIIDDHFEAHDDWTDASFDMGLAYKEGFNLSQSEDEQKDTFAAFVVTRGDCYAEVGVLILGFALTHDDLIILIGQSDEDFHYVFFPIN